MISCSINMAATTERLTDTTTGMGRSTEVERINVTLHTSRLDATLLHPLDQEFRVVDSLRTGQDLFPSHEEIIRVGQGRVGSVGHGVERSDGERELVEDVVVGAVLFLDESTEPSFVFGAVRRVSRVLGYPRDVDSPQIVMVAQLGTIEVLGPGIPQHLDPIGKRELQRLVQPGKLVTRELSRDRGDLVRVLLLQPLEDGQEQ